MGGYWCISRRTPLWTQLWHARTRRGTRNAVAAASCRRTFSGEGRPVPLFAAVASRWKVSCRAYLHAGIFGPGYVSLAWIAVQRPWGSSPALEHMAHMAFQSTFFVSVLESAALFRIVGSFPRFRGRPSFGIGATFSFSQIGWAFAGSPLCSRACVLACILAHLAATERHSLAWVEPNAGVSWRQSSHARTHARARARARACVHART
mmetsp:Transcript_46293/g.143215  ORF Transcript_46293/g.143215 Transcript_46293/m.143215 type:complete len:207 (+) Transcript_46293:956-1576(+)